MIHSSIENIYEFLFYINMYATYTTKTASDF